MPFHFEFEAKTRSIRKIRKLVEALYKHAQTLPFIKIGELHESTIEEYEAESEACQEFVTGFIGRWVFHPD